MPAVTGSSGRRVGASKRSSGAVIGGSAIGTGDLAVGDRLRIPRLGPVELIVSGSPLRWNDPDRRSIAVIGLSPTDDVVGSVATKVDEDG